MPNPERTSQDARAKARDPLAALPDKSLKTLIEAARAKYRTRIPSPTDAADPNRPMRGRPPLATPKHLVSLRLDQSVIAAFRATGPGWQSRINTVLCKNLPPPPTANPDDSHTPHPKPNENRFLEVWLPNEASNLQPSDGKTFGIAGAQNTPVPN